jgi:hypothetical protein
MPSEPQMMRIPYGYYVTQMEDRQAQFIHIRGGCLAAPGTRITSTGIEHRSRNDRIQEVATLQTP